MQEEKRQKYLEAAMIMNRLLDSRYFPDVMMFLNDKSKDEFAALCRRIEISDGMIDTLWKTLEEVNKKMADEPGWIL